MPRTWYLDTETKGTGAHVAPLDRARERRPEKDELDLVTFKVSPAHVGSSASADVALCGHAPLAFKVLDVMTSRVLAEGVDARAVVDLFEGFSSLVDVRIYARPRGAQRWRLLGVDELRVLWSFRGIRAGAA